MVEFVQNIGESQGAILPSPLALILHQRHTLLEVQPTPMLDQDS